LKIIRKIYNKPHQIIVLITRPQIIQALLILLLITIIIIIITLTTNNNNNKIKMNLIYQKLKYIVTKITWFIKYLINLSTKMILFKNLRKKYQNKSRSLKKHLYSNIKIRKLIKYHRKLINIWKRRKFYMRLPKMCHLLLNLIIYKNIRFILIN
jgi:hypothetical protein